MSINIKDIKRITKDYLDLFPLWNILGNNILFRDNGPILQGLLFERASTDVYRPTGFIRVLCAPNPVDAMIMELPQGLSYPNGAPCRSISLQSHEKVIFDVVGDMKTQIYPPLDLPLAPIKVLAFYVKEAVPTIIEAYSLGALHAYFGLNKDAKEWIKRYKQLVLEQKMEDIDSEYEAKRENFINELEIWIGEGIANEKLRKIIDEEKKKLGINE
jgi:hypothetical protein